MAQDNIGISFGRIVAHEEMEHLEMVLRNPLGPSDTILQGQDLLRKIRAAPRQLKQEG